MIKVIRFAEYNIFYKLRISWNKMPIVIISHGFKGWKNWGFFPYICEQFAEKGAIVLCLNFSLNGNPDDFGFITNIDNFAKNTISQEIHDLESILIRINSKSCNELEEIADYWNGEIFLLGHSLGAGVSLIVGNTNDSVKKIAIWGSIGKFNRYSRRQIAIWKKNGFIEFNNQSTNQILRMNYDYIEDILRNESKFNIAKIIEENNKPILMIHGKQDITVPLKELDFMISSDVRYNIETHIVEKAGHTFGVEHPFQGKNDVLDQIVKISSEFFCLNQN